MLIDKNKQLYDVRPLFQAKGIKFPAGMSAIYNLPAKTLTTVTVYPEEAIHMEELVVFGFNSGK